MFEEFTAGENDADAVTGAYLANRVIRHRSLGSVDFLLHRGTASEGITPAQINIARKLIQAIEKKEKKPLKEVAESACSSYGDALYEIILKHSRSRQPPDEGTVAKILQEMRDSFDLIKRPAPMDRSQRIRSLLAANPKMKAKDVIAALKKEGYTVPKSVVPYIQGLKAKSGRGRSYGIHKPIATVGGKRGIKGSKLKTLIEGKESLDTIRQVKKLVDKMGSAKLKQLIDAVVK